MTPGRRPPATRTPRRAGWLAAGFAASAALHAAALAALLLWPGTGPEELPGDGGSVALVFADTLALAGGGEAAPPEALPAPPAPAAPPEPAAIPPPPAPERLAALVPPPPVAPPALAPPPPVEPVRPTEAPPQPAPPPVPVAVPAPEPEPIPPPAEAPAATTEAAAEQAESLPTPPPFEQRQVAAAAQPERPAAPPRPAPAPRPAAEPVRLGAGAGALPDPSLGARATGAVVPPGAADGYRNAPPDYPPDSRRRGEEGVVRLSLSIGIDGRVAEASVAVSSGHSALDAAAVAAARRWRFRPATQAGLPVPATLATAVHFRLTEGERR